MALSTSLSPTSGRLGSTSRYVRHIPAVAASHAALLSARSGTWQDLDYTFTLVPVSVIDAVSQQPVHPLLQGTEDSVRRTALPADGEAAHHLGVQDPVPGRAVPSVAAQGYLYGLRPDHPGRCRRAVEHGPGGTQQPFFLHTIGLNTHSTCLGIFKYTYHSRQSSHGSHVRVL